MARIIFTYVVVVSSPDVIYRLLMLAPQMAYLRFKEVQDLTYCAQPSLNISQYPSANCACFLRHHGELTSCLSKLPL
eukprot:9485691-Pyramimonas_sp.AAC.1